MDEELWRSTVGGSDLGNILGHGWETPLQTWRRKQGLETIRVNEAMRMGTLCEPYIVELFEERMGWKVERGAKGQEGIYRWTLDGLLPQQDALLECKWKNVHMKQFFEGDNPPLSDYMQAQWYAGWAGVSTIFYAVMFGGPPIEVYPLKANPAVFERLKREATEWWEAYMVTGVEPPWTEVDESNYRPKPKEGRSGMMSDILEALAWDLADVRAGRKAMAKKERDSLESRVRVLMGEYGQMDGNGIRLVKKLYSKKKPDYEAAFREIVCLYGLRQIDTGYAEILDRNSSVKEREVLYVRIEE